VTPHLLVLLEPLPHPFDVRVRAQVKAFTAAGWAVTVVCPTGYGLEARAETVDGVRIRRFKAPGGGSGALGYAREYGISMLQMARLTRAVARERPVDAVMVCNPPDALVALALPLARRGAGVLFDYREISPELFEAKFRRRGLIHRALVATERFAFRYVDTVIAVSEPFAELARTRGGVPADHVFLVGNGADPERVYPVPARPELRHGRGHLVVWLGSMSSQENLGLLVDAAEHVVRRHGRDDIQFAIVGHGDAEQPLRQEVARRNLGGWVELAGSVGDDLMRAYICTADVCVNVDERNAMSDRTAMRKVLEYMALGRPIVQFPLAEMRRICGDTTVYARDGDAADLADRVCELIDDEERRRTLGEAARRRVEAGLTWPQQVPALLAAADLAVLCGQQRMFRSAREPGRTESTPSVAARHPSQSRLFVRAARRHGIRP
jgi:glycosyltransferase involved in cell wall biosynthesis